jgi:hypothetical protein
MQFGAMQVLLGGAGMVLVGRGNLGESTLDCYGSTDRKDAVHV